MLEGSSYLLLLFIAVPLKYLVGDESFVKLLGMPHGVLFILYIVFAFIFQKKMKWSLINFLIILDEVSLLPSSIKINSQLE